MSAFDPDRHHRRSLRYPTYDYREPGAYFFTICVLERALALGRVVDGAMLLRDLGESVLSVWRGLADHYPTVALDAFVIMPNHVHGIVMLQPAQGAKGQTAADARPSLGDVIGRFKSLSTRAAWQLGHSRLWQRNYYEHVIRNGHELQAIREYIVMNPARWDRDPEHLA